MRRSQREGVGNWRRSSSADGGLQKRLQRFRNKSRPPNYTTLQINRPSETVSSRIITSTLYLMSKRKGEAGALVGAGDQRESYGTLSHRGAGHGTCRSHSTRTAPRWSSSRRPPDVCRPQVAAALRRSGSGRAAPRLRGPGQNTLVYVVSIGFDSRAMFTFLAVTDPRERHVSACRDDIDSMWLKVLLNRAYLYCWDMRDERCH